MHLARIEPAIPASVRPRIDVSRGNLAEMCDNEPRNKFELAVWTQQKALLMEEINYKYGYVWALLKGSKTIYIMIILIVWSNTYGMWNKQTNGNYGKVVTTGRYRYKNTHVKIPFIPWMNTLNSKVKFWHMFWIETRGLWDTCSFSLLISLYYVSIYPTTICNEGRFPM